MDLENCYSVYSFLGLNAGLEDNDFSTYYLRDGKARGRSIMTMLCHGNLSCTRVMHGVEFEDSSASQKCLKHWAPEQFTLKPN